MVVPAPGLGSLPASQVRPPACGEAPGRLSRPRSPAKGTPAITVAQLRAKPLHVHDAGGCGPALGAMPAGPQS